MDNHHHLIWPRSTTVDEIDNYHYPKEHSNIIEYNNDYGATNNRSYPTTWSYYGANPSDHSLIAFLQFILHICSVF